MKKNTPYFKLRKSYVIFICKSDPFDRNLGYYTFNSWCDEDKTLNLRDEATKILLNTKGDKNGMSKELKAFLEFIDTNSPTDEYTKCLADTVKTIKEDEGARDLYMTIEQQMMEVREEMQQYIVAAKQEAADAKQKAANAERKNIANIITMCRNNNYSDEQTINQLMEMADLSHEEASNKLLEYQNI